MDRRTMIIGTALATVAAAARAVPQGTDSSQQLNTLFDQFMKENLDLSPLLVTSLGLDSGARAAQKSHVDDGSLAGFERQKALIASQLARIRAFDRARLSATDAISYDVVMYGLRTSDAANKAFHYGNKAFLYGPIGAGAPYRLSQLTGAYQELPAFLDNQHTIQTKADADAYVARLAGFATLLDQEVEVTRHDVAMGAVPPDFALAKTLAQLQALRAPSPEQSGLTTSVVRRAKEKNIPGDYAQQASRVVQQQVYPALERQIALVAEMQKRSSHDAGVWRLPDGEAYYAASLVTWTTTGKEPAEIHALGLELVKEHTASINALMQKVGMTRGSVGERLRAMYADPKFQYANTDAGKDALLADLNARVQRIRDKLPNYFGTLPRANVEIKRVPREIEAGAPSGYYNESSLDGKRPGIYWINLRDTSEQPKWALPTLTYHESIPGHHLQLAIQQEADLPLIRKAAFYSAYAEGWALYSEQLAAEMGEYDDDPFGHIGQLHDSMFRAVRLVVDTGMHSKRWTREQAVQYFTETLGDPEAAASTEVERYCVWPGQACAYMLGKRTFLEQRARAQQVLGAKYDVRKFHDAMLLPGAVPLELLERIYV
jgi:uncharacterized protein (DUF885 family)